MVRFGYPEDEPWYWVTAAELETFLKSYPRPLEVEPPLHCKARFRTYGDLTLGQYPHHVVAQVNSSRRGAIYQIRRTLPPDVHFRPLEKCKGGESSEATH